MESWVAKLIVEVTVNLIAEAIILSLKQTHKLCKAVIKEAQRRQAMQQIELLNSYADMEEVLGEFLEKYRNLSRQTPTPKRWGFVFTLARDICGLVKALFAMAITRLISKDETPRA